MYNFLKDKTALYIEDEADVLKNISELLSNFFGGFYTASNAETGYSIFLDNKVDVLLVDIELPKMNGIDLIKEIRKMDKHIPIIVISAYTKTDYLLESIELNLDKYIVKPLTSRKIHILLESLNEDFINHDVFSFNDNVILYKKRSVIKSFGVEYNLSKRELRFLSVLKDQKVITYDEILLLWEDDIPTENAIRSFVKYLRKKLPENLLKNRNGIGYYIESRSQCLEK
jgi:DNA-binding response OmpR family regulator